MQIIECHCKFWDYNFAPSIAQMLKKIFKAQQKTIKNHRNSFEKPVVQQTQI